MSNDEKCDNVKIPSIDDVGKERDRLKNHTKHKKTIINAICICVVVMALLLAITMLLPVLKMYGASMAPTINEGEMVVLLKTGKFNNGDIIAFYHNNKILTKRVIAGPGSWVNMDDDGTVYVDDKKLDEPYISKKELGNCNIGFPYHVPDGKYFVMGDNRGESVDSRNTAVGCVAKEEVKGKIIFAIWPIKEIEVFF